MNTTGIFFKYSRTNSYYILHYGPNEIYFKGKYTALKEWIDFDYGQVATS